MNVTMLHQISGTRNGAAWPKPGESIDLPESEARDLIAIGMAVEIPEIGRAHV